MEELEFTGALLDPRTEEEKQKDYQHDEVAMATPVFWVEKSSYRYFDKRNQTSSGSCMAQSGVKMLGVENFVEEGEYVNLSAKPIYKARTNAGAGMFQQECLSLLAKPLSCLESQLPSQNIGELEINKSYYFTDAMKEMAEKYKAGGYVFVPFDMDKIASVVEQGKAVQIMLYFTADEYWREVPEIIHEDLDRYDDKTSRHGVAVVDYTLYKGKKAFVIEDSAGNSSSIDENGQRIITEQFFNKRCFGAGYLIELENKPGRKVSYEFTKLLKFGSAGLEVQKLQDVLKSLGFFPNIPGTGKFLQITKKAVQAFQKSKGLTPDGIIGPITREKLNNL